MKPERSNMYSEGEKLLLMGSSKFQAKELPLEIRDRLDAAMQRRVTFIVAEEFGSCRLFQDYLASNNYENVIVGHARSIRYNAGDWKDFKYGDNLKERERNMIKDCNYAIVIWQDSSSVIAENLENLKRLEKPTFLYEYDSSDGTIQVGELDLRRSYKKFAPYWKRFRKKEKVVFEKWFSEQAKHD
ncbi:MAG: hypothetical protein ACXAES_02070 [Promethearchaeota archaeon]